MTRSGSRILTTHVGSLIRPANLLARSKAAKESDLKAALAATGVEDGFLTAVAPASAGYDSSNEYYSDDRNYVFAIAEALREEYLEVINAGLMLQVDDAVLANMYDDLIQHGPARYRQWAELRIEALNHALRGIPADRVRYHVCFGSWHVPHMADAPLEAIAPLILVGRENVIAGTDCGFAQLETYQRVHPQVMWAKLNALSEGARLASQELWPRARPFGRAS